MSRIEGIVVASISRASLATRTLNGRESRGEV
jgi:hypothetical protein